MKTIQQILIILSLTALVACNSNKLKTDEKTLVKAIHTEEEQLTYEEELRKEREQQLADSLAKLPKGFRFKEDRSVDPAHPPLIIDIEGNLKNFKSFWLSDFASEIEYILMEEPNDSLLLPTMKTKYLMLDDYIVSHYFFGINLYSKKGAFIGNIISNQISGVEYIPEKNMLVSNGTNTHIGASEHVWNDGNTLFYTYVNRFTGQQYIMGLDCKNLPISMSSGFDPENPKKIIGAGSVLLDLNHGQAPPMDFDKHVKTGLLNYKSMLNTMLTYSLDKNTYYQPSRGKNMLVIFNNNGDTLTVFKKLEQLKNYTKSLKRGVDRGFNYQKNGKHYLRTDYNDTIFQILPPNRLLPVYVLNLGKHKMEKQGGVDPGVSLEGKIIPDGFAEFNNHIFISFLKDNYDCPYNRRSKLVKMFYGIYNTNNKLLALVNSDSLDYNPDILINDIDGGISVWPGNYNAENSNEILIPLFGWELKKRVKSVEFENSIAPTEKKAILKRLSEVVSDNDRILMIIK